MRLCREALLEQVAPDLHVRCSNRVEDVVADESFQRLAGHLLDNEAQNLEAQIAVGIAGAGGKIQGLRDHVPDRALGGGKERTADGRGNVFAERRYDRVAADGGIPAAGVFEKLADGNGLNPRIAPLAVVWLDAAEDVEGPRG